jgi:hypothetical protein
MFVVAIPAMGISVLETISKPFESI